jgi:PAS domain S-box-containing protein
MNINELKKLSREELIEYIENLNKWYDLDTSGIDLRLADFRTMVESAYDIIFTLDKDRRVQYRNKAWLETFPSRPAEIGKLYTEYLHEIELERGNMVLDSVLKDGQIFDNELLRIYEDGKPIYFVTNFSPIRAGNEEIVGLLAIMRNYTEQHQTQKKLKENTKILEEKVKEQIKQAEELRNLRDLNEEIINNAPIGLFIVDPSGIVILENPKLSEIMVREPNSLVGVNVIAYSGFIEAGFTALFEQALATKKTTRINEARYIPISGKRELVLSLTFDPIISRSGVVEKVLVMLEDVTEEVNNRHSINRAEKMTALGVLASGVASELKTYINNMAMDLNFVDTNVDEYSPAAEYIDSLKKELERIKTISEQLLSLAVIDERDKEVCELNKIVNGHPVDVIINRLRKEGYDVHVNLPDESPEVLATPSQLQQLLIQFIENAEDAIAPTGYILIDVESVKNAEGSYAVLTITDDGMGMPEENLKKVFQPFFTTKGKKGTGLGLMIVMNIIANLGGTIGVKTKPGEGTSIRVVLPQAKK